MNANVVIGTLLLMVGGGFEIARHDAAMIKDRDERLYQIHLHSSDVYLTEAYRIQGQADWELNTFGQTPVYNIMREEARESLDTSTQERSMAVENFGSADQESKRERLYKVISISNFAVGTILILEGLYQEYQKDKRESTIRIQFKPTRDLRGGQLSFSKLF